jgi:hypothetical protein
LEQHGIKNSVEFKIYEDKNIFSMKSLPLIDMEWDNDCESEWSDVYEGVNIMSNSLSMAIMESFSG